GDVGRGARALGAAPAAARGPPGRRDGGGDRRCGERAARAASRPRPRASGGAQSGARRRRREVRSGQCRARRAPRRKGTHDRSPARRASTKTAQVFSGVAKRSSGATSSRRPVSVVNRAAAAGKGFPPVRCSSAGEGKRGNSLFWLAGSAVISTPVVSRLADQKRDGSFRSR